MSNRIVNILWTGGLDSSYRVIELSQMEGITIQPYYIVDPVRSSLQSEMNAIKKISDIIRQHERTKSILLDVKLIYINDIKQDSLITNAFNRLHDKYIIGHQYDFIARYAKQYNIRFEMSLEKSDRSKAMNCILTETTLEPFVDGDYSVFRVNSHKSTADGCAIYSHIDLPSTLWSMTKVEEVEKLNQMEHKETIKYTWFCHFPVWGKPCGHCNPCRDCMHEGLAFRISKIGYILYYIYKPYKSIKNRIFK